MREDDGGGPEDDLPSESEASGDPPQADGSDPIAPTGDDSSRGDDSVSSQPDDSVPPQTGDENSPQARASNEPVTQPSFETDESRHQPPRGPEPPQAQKEEGPSWYLYVFDLVSSVGIVLVIGLLLFSASGIWPPMVAVESGSMQPVLERGDLVYVMEADRFPGPGAQGETGVVTEREARSSGYQKFGGNGDVIVFEPNGNAQDTPVIHRAMMWVEEDENWVEDANPAFLRGEDECSDFSDDICPAPYDGFITKGDHNGAYDQVTGISEVVRAEWVIGTAEVYVPYLGEIRLGSAFGANTAVPPSVHAMASPPEGSVSTPHETTVSTAGANVSATGTNVSGGGTSDTVATAR